MKKNKPQKHKLRILFSSNAPWAPSGYGTQMRDLLPMIRDAGYDVGIVCFYGLQGGKLIIDGITCYPQFDAGMSYGAAEVPLFQDDFKADLVMTLQDIWTLDVNLLKQYRNWVPIVPIDHEPVQSAVYERLKLAYRIVTYSEFGKEELQRKGMHSTYIQHTVNTDVLKPLSAEQKLEIRKKLNVPEDFFMFGMVAANKEWPPRKSFQHVLDAFKKFHDKHPKSGIYFHAHMGPGFAIEEYAKFLGINDVVYKIPPYDLMFNVDRDGMNQIYNMMDCLLMPSTNEGFGVPAIEAQAAGVPVITNDFTAMPELVTPKTGRVCKVGFKRFDNFLSYIAEPDVDSLYESMEEIFDADRIQMAKDCREHAEQNYSLNKIFKEKWLPFLSKLESELVR